MPLWALLPAAGTGSRFGGTTPKQFLPLVGRSVLEHSLDAVLAHPRVTGAVVCLHPEWMDFPIQSHHDKPVMRVPGGPERAHSVLAGLEALPPTCEWVLVHDAARPCLRQDDLHHLIASMEQFPQGAILAAPVRDTMKRGDADGCIDHTVDRKGLWHALTPQLFPRARLTEVLGRALKQGLPVTDEASAMEWAGETPGLVSGSHRNVKITHSDDLALARFFLESA